MESRRRVGSPVLVTLQQGCLPVVLALAGAALVAVVALMLPQQLLWLSSGVSAPLLGLSLVFLVLVQAVTGGAVNVLVLAQTAPLISTEVELQSWGLLRATVLTVHEIVMAKLAAALYHLRRSLMALLILRAITAITALLLLAVALLRSTFYYSPDRWDRWVASGVWLPLTLAGLLFLVWYVAQPVVQFLLNGTLGIFASTAGRSRSRSMASALGLRMGLWVASITLNVGLIYGAIYLIVINWASPSTAPLEAFRRGPTPTDEQVLWVTAVVAFFYIAIVAAIQAGLIAGGLSIGRRRAERISG